MSHRALVEVQGRFRPPPRSARPDGFFQPRKKHLRLGVVIGEKERWIARAEELGLEVSPRRRRLFINIDKRNFEGPREFLRKLIQEAVKRYEDH